MKRDWSAWRVGEESRVQINRPDLAKAFSRVKGVWLAGYSVAGTYMKLFHVKQPIAWVEEWIDKLMPQLAKSN